MHKEEHRIQTVETCKTEPPSLCALSLTVRYVYFTCSVITMVIDGLHLLLTYKCNFECDHCFVYSHPHAKGVMKISQIRRESILTPLGMFMSVKA